MDLTRRTRIYVAGPITKGNQMDNIRIAVLAANQLADDGYAPYCPHLTFFWHILAPRTYESWTALDNEWIPLCDALLRLPGESSGSDAEVKFAIAHGIPVYYSREELRAHEPPTRYWGK